MDYLRQVEKLNTDISQNETQQALCEKESASLELQIVESFDIIKMYRQMLSITEAVHNAFARQESLSLQFKISQRETDINTARQVQTETKDQILSLQRKAMKLSRERAPLLERIEQDLSRLESRRANRNGQTVNAEAPPEECTSPSRRELTGDNEKPDQIQAAEAHSS